MSMPITKKQVEELYYKWWCGICKSIDADDRNKFRSVLSVIEAYRADSMYYIIQLKYIRDCKEADFNRNTWFIETMHEVIKVMTRDAARIKSMVKAIPELLVCIAGVILRVRSTADLKSAVNTILLLDALTEASVEAIQQLDLARVRFLKDGKSIYPHILEPDLHSVISVTKTLLDGNPELCKEVECEYGRRGRVLTKVLGLTAVE